MTTVVSAKLFTQAYFNFTETSGTSVYSDVESAVSQALYTYGSTGVLTIDAAVSSSGVVPSGSFVQIDLSALTNTRFGVTYTVPMSGIKAVSINNLATTSGYNMTVQATGSNAFTPFFNGGSGNLMIRPYSSFVFNDPYGTRTSPTSKVISLRNVSQISNSGVPYSITVMGNLT